MELCFFVILVMYSMFILLFWVVNSLVMELFISVVCIIMGSVLIYLVSSSPWFFYIIMLSIVGGFMVLLSFVMMTSPNSSGNIISKFSHIAMVMLMLFSMSVLMYLMNLDDSTELLEVYYSQLYKSNYMIVFPFLFALLFLLILLLLMLMVIDCIVITKGGSVLM